MSIIVSKLTAGSNNHLTTAEEGNAVYTDFVSEGIVGSVTNTSGVAPATGGFSVNAQGTPDMTVAVGSGVAYVTGTPTSQNSQTFRVKNSASANTTISANSSGSTKYDWVYIKLDATNLNTPNTAGDDVATIVTSRSSSSSSDDGTPPTYGYPIAIVTVANGASSITNSNIRDIRTQVALNTGSNNATDGWTALSTTTLTTATGYNKGQKEYDITSSADLTGVLSPGMRLKVTRATTPPTQCADLESSSSQYASKTSPAGLTFTDDFTCEAWVKLESYTLGGIVARRNADTEGWSLEINSSGQISLTCLRIASNNAVVQSYQSIPLDEWVHIAANYDLSGTTANIYLNGVLIPSLKTVTGTCTALVQGTTALVVGAQKSAGTSTFDGKIADVRVWSTIRTATQVRDNMNQQLVGNESNLVAYFKLDGALTDSTSNANDLTGSGGAVATNTDNPMNSTEYAIITKVTASTITVFTGTSYNIPNLTLSTPYYSTQKSPFGFNPDRRKWRVTSLLRSTNSVTSNATYGAFISGGYALTVPIGAFEVGQRGCFLNTTTTTVYFNISSTALTGMTSVQGNNASPYTITTKSSAAAYYAVTASVSQPQTLTAQATYVMYTLGATTSASIDTDATNEIFAECNYI